MRTVVVYKWAADYQEATVDGNGEVDWSRARAVVSDYDAVAIEVARQLAEATSGEAVGLCLGGQVAALPISTKTALARGMDRAVVIADEALVGAGTTLTAELLARGVEHIGEVDLVLAGDSSIDIAAKMVSSVVAGWLNWPAFTDITSVEIEQDKRLLLTRPIAGGTETFRVAGPAVVALSADAVNPRTPGMKDILAAGKKPVEVLAPDALGGEPESKDAVVTGRARPLHAARKQQVIEADDPAAAVGQLVGILRDAGVL